MVQGPFDTSFTADSGSFPKPTRNTIQTFVEEHTHAFKGSETTSRIFTSWDPSDHPVIKGLTAKKTMDLQLYLHYVGKDF
ncbi:MAG TPA: hypothetical protein DCZ04_07355 [Syntrophorhabdus aromaticivorans]|nr:hypothetical protein [Syntrophorhabdus aromaticivorans]